MMPEKFETIGTLTVTNSFETFIFDLSKYGDISCENNLHCGDRVQLTKGN